MTEERLRQHNVTFSHPSMLQSGGSQLNFCTNHPRNSCKKFPSLLSDQKGQLMIIGGREKMLIFCSCVRMNLFFLIIITFQVW